MRKQTKVVAVASAAALLAIGGAMTSFAAQGWVEEDGTWYFYDKDGSRVEDTWKKSGDNWFWLDSEEGGAMATDKLVEDDDNTYYVDGNGVMVTNTWVKVVNEEQDEDDDPAEYRYYYMQSNGKAYKGNGNNLSKKTIDGKQYAFDEDGKMLYGWVKTDGTMANGEDEWQDAYYYFGGWEDGSLKTGWQKITVYDQDEDDDYDYWFNFKSNGKKRFNESDSKDILEKKINGKHYAFDNRGVMTYEWTLTTTSDASTISNWLYFNSPEDGARATKGWFKVVAPDKDGDDNTFKDYSNLENPTFAKGDAEDENERWYYANSDGELYVGQIKKIKGKYYGFWPDDGEKAGRMLTGLCALKMSGSKIVDVIDDDMDADGLDDFMDKYGTESQANSDVYLYYFGNDADTDGAMKTGNVTINLDGDSYQFQFKKNGDASSRGRGVNGIDDGKYIYQYGQKVKADSDEKYILVKAVGNINSDTATVDVYESKDIRTEFAKTAFQVTGTDATVNGFYGFGSAYYLVNTSGRIQTGTKTGVKDGDDMYWYMNNNKIVMYTDSKELKGTKLNSNGWKTVDFSKLSK